MPDLPQNLNAGGEPPSYQPLPNVPPPPPEVKVRTLRSDLESMAKSGGAAPQFENIKAPSLAGLGDGRAAAAKKTGAPLSTIAVIIIALGLVAAIGYFVYQIFFSLNPAALKTETPAQSFIPVATSPPPAIGTSGGFVHFSLLKNPPDKSLTLIIESSAQNSTELKTYTQQIKDLVSGDKTSTFFEINVKGSDGRDFSINEIFSAAGAAVFDSKFLSDHFNKDSTVFVYRDKNGLWPGYVLALEPSENWLFLRDDVSRMVESKKVEIFFASSPGPPEAGGFKDTVVSGQPARALRFNSGASFIYGWFRGYLVLSTSEDGLKVALARL